MIGLSFTSKTLTLSEEELDDKVIHVLDSLWEEYKLFNYQIIKTEPTISIGIDTSKDMAGLHSALEKQLPKQALEDYEIEIFQRHK
ncbi:hypothetical protein QPL77_17830 [Bacillus pumilus]|uniref:hypothetical protein n=1 Tax=Bacillus pumilus TaxID=1408 RepID=UPI001B3A6E89|nr:hypothetical protein [Bacillus pumilus]MBQ4814770.1 hypothetical protein [Bacillus pumilus]WIG31813.1 hypothetical protein QPL77_17830 [Bacillus pumilus]